MMVEEILQTVKSELTKRGAIVSDSDAVAELESRGYGERKGKKLTLKDYEAAYLMYNDKIELNRKGKPVMFEEFISHTLKKNNDAWTGFLIYRDLRSRGYVVREGFGFGVDFRLYNRGDFDKKPAKYVIFGLNEGSRLSAKKLSDTVHQISRMGKDPIIAVIERRGEVIYYRASRAKFKES